MIETALVIAALLIPTAIDTAIQIYIHFRTVKHVHVCPYCPHMECPTEVTTEEETN